MLYSIERRPEADPAAIKKLADGPSLLKQARDGLFSRPSGCIGELAYELREWICRSSRQLAVGTSKPAPKIVYPSCVPFKTTGFLAEIQVGERRKIPMQLPTG